MLKRVQFELGDEFLAEFGRITVRFATLESMTGRLVSSLIGENDDVGRIVSSAISIKRRLDIIDSLVRLATDDSGLISKTEKALRQVASAEERRNTFMHSQWLEQIMSQDGEFEKCAGRSKVTAKRGKGLRHQEEILRPNEIREVAEQIYSAYESLCGLWFALGSAGLLHDFIVLGDGEIKVIGEDGQEC